jgi:hypothetical protein
LRMARNQRRVLPYARSIARPVMLRSRR